MDRIRLNRFIFVIAATLAVSGLCQEADIAARFTRAVDELHEACNRIEDELKQAKQTGNKQKIAELEAKLQQTRDRLFQASKDAKEINLREHEHQAKVHELQRAFEFREKNLRGEADQLKSQMGALTKELERQQEQYEEVWLELQAAHEALEDYKKLHTTDPFGTTAPAKLNSNGLAMGHSQDSQENMANGKTAERFRLNLRYGPFEFKTKLIFTPGNRLGSAAKQRLDLGATRQPSN